MKEVPMLLEMATQIRLQTVTDKNPENPTAHLRSIDTTIPLVFKFNQLYYERDKSTEFLFSSAELVQIHGNVGHDRPRST